MWRLFGDNTGFSEQVAGGLSDGVVAGDALVSVVREARGDGEGDAIGTEPGEEDDAGRGGLGVVDAEVGEVFEEGRGDAGLAVGMEVLG